MSFDPSIDYYAVLGVLPTVDEVVIKAAYRALAQRYHPDKVSGDVKRATERLAEINAAYSILSDPVTRRDYDQARSVEGQGSSEYFGESADESEPPFDPLDAAWGTAVEYYPDLPNIYSALSNISWRLAYAFKAEIIERRCFEQRESLAKTLEEEFMKCHFGTNPLILCFARDLIRTCNKLAARELNQAVTILGTNVDPQRVIAKIKQKFGIDTAEREVAALQLARTRRNWGYGNDAINKILIEMGLTEAQCYSVLSRL